MSKPSSARLTFFGATGTVTGSKSLLELGRTRLLIDCGLFQGFKQLRVRNWSSPPFALRELDAVVLTHAHIDHSGYLPLLVKRGYKGPIFCTAGTHELCKILLPDSGRIQEADAEYANRRGLSKHRPALPLYTEEDARRALRHFESIEFDGPLTVAKDVEVGFTHAGHIVGAASVLVESPGLRVLFSGDVGRPNDPLMRPPAPPPPADYVVLESTYGDRLHPRDEAEGFVAAILRDCVARGGAVVVPAFAVGRTQALLLVLSRVFDKGLAPRIPVYLDSPMAISATDLCIRFADEHRLDLDEASRVFDLPIYVREVEDSKALDRRTGPMVLVSASGMATGGRVVHHLKHFAPDPANTIMFSGFQAGGTRGAKLVAGAPTVRIHGEDVPVRARIENLEHLSAHADANELIAWLAQAPTPPKQVFLNHGEPAACDALRLRIGDELGWPCTVADFREEVELAG